MAKDSRKSMLLSLGALVLGTTMAVASAHAATGRTVGNFNVSNAGTASYSIPIFTPPGPRGMQPNIALVYSSAGGKGYLGRGWSLAGFSTIGRCNFNLAQDGKLSAVDLSKSSGYCMDGNRLRLYSGTYGESGSVYATEVADFSRITASGSTGPGNLGGPESWVVERKDGTIYTYGGTSDSRVSVSTYIYPAGTGSTPRVWKLNKIEDRYGNKVLFSYKSQDSATSGTTHPTAIYWTQTSAGSGSYIHSIEFAYNATSTNTLPSSFNGFAGGNVVRETDLLTSISVKVSGTTVRKYALGYETSATTGGKRLVSVTECSDAAQTDCLAPTVIAYQNGQTGIVATPAFTTSGSIDAVSGRFDYNGDGLRDLAYRRSNYWYVRFASTSGYGSEVATGVYNLGLMAGDPFGNGRDVIMGLNGTSTWHAYIWNGSSFAPVSTGVTTAYSSNAISMADVNGDGRDDIASVRGTESMDAMDGTAFFSTSSGSTLSFDTEGLGSYYTPTPPEEGGYLAVSYTYLPTADRLPWFIDDLDVNGDGAEEFLVNGTPIYCWEYCYEYAYSAAVAMFWDGYSYAPREFTESDFIHQYSPVSANDDGCTDMVSVFPDGLPSVLHHTGCGALGWSTDNPDGPVRGIVDWDADGRRDVLVSLTGYSTLYVQRSTGQGLASPENTGLPLTCIMFLTDANGDGLDDVGCLYSGSSIAVHMHNGSSVVPDLATTFTDGFGVSQAVSYAHSTHEGYTPSNTASYPQKDVVRNRVLVRTVTATDGIGGNYTITYSYFGATEDVLGRGFQGFDKIETVDSRNSVKHVRRFSRTFPYTGMLIEESYYQPGGTLMSSRIVTPGSQTLDATAGNQRYFSYPESSVEDVYEVSGTKNGDLITRTEVSNTFDSSGNLTALTRTVTDKDSSSPLYNQSWTTATSTTFSSSTDRTTYWCQGLPIASSVTSSTTVSGEPGVTRSNSFTPDYFYCRMSAESVEPSSSTLRVDKSYGYDGFGNLNSLSVTGRNPNGSSMSARTTIMSWGTTGQFPVSETNALSQTTTRTFHSTFGSLLTNTDPNGIVVINNTYDSFGRINYSARPDGTYTSYYYSDCAATSCLNGDPGSGVTSIDKMVFVSQEMDASNAEISVSSVHSDQFDRPIVQISKGLDGNWLRAGRQYDAIGQVYRETAPCSYYSCMVYWTTNTYDLLGRITQQSRPRSDSDATAVTTSFAYAGRTQTVVDANSKVSTKVLDVNGWMRRSVDHDSYLQAFWYDAAGSLKQVTDSLSNYLFIANYSYGIRAFQTDVEDMDLGGRAYVHNSLGELVSWTDAKSQNFSLTYDALSRVTSRTESEGTTTFGWGASAGAKNIGRLYYVTMPGYTDTFTYDSAGRLSNRNVATDQYYDIDFTYNSQGLLDTLTYPVSTSSTRVKVKYGYAYGILQSVTDWTSGSAGTVYWTASAQNPRGQTTQETLGNGVVTNRSFDAVTGWLNSIQSGVSGGTGLQNQAYAYDKIGNITQRQENSLGLTENFYYDNLYRLDYSTLNDGGGAATNLDMAYDAMGNITSRSDVNSGASWTYHSTKKHAVTSTGSGGTSYTYDANGNMTSRGGSTISWTSYDYPSILYTATESAVFYYGPYRQYYRQEYGGPGVSESTYYVGGLLEKVTSSGVTDWRHYIQAGGQIVAIVSRKSSGGNAVNYPLEDHLDSLTEFTDNSGTMVARESYAAFGSPRDGSDWNGPVAGGDLAAISGITRRGYTGHSMLGNMGLIHMNGRVQDSITGRFLSADPNVPNPGFTQSWNRYTYVNNNPLSYIDPSGFGEVDETCDVWNSARQDWECPETRVTAPLSCAPWQLAVYYSSGGGECIDRSLFDPFTGAYRGPSVGEEGAAEPHPYRSPNLPPPPRPAPRPVSKPQSQQTQNNQGEKPQLCPGGTVYTPILVDVGGPGGTVEHSCLTPSGRADIETAQRLSAVALATYLAPPAWMSLSTTQRVDLIGIFVKVIGGTEGRGMPRPPSVPRPPPPAVEAPMPAPGQPNPFIPPFP